MSKGKPQPVPDRVGERTEQDIFVAGGIKVHLETELTRDADGVLCVGIDINTAAPVRLAVWAPEEE